jgi:hypothetical protein
MDNAPHTDHTKPIVILEARAEGGSLTVVGIKADNAWRFRVVRNEAALYDLLKEEDREGLVFRDESDWVGSWPDALELLDKYHWHELHAGQVHPEFRQKVWAAVQRRSSRRRPLSLSMTMRRLVQYVSKSETRKNARRAKACARQQLDRWRRVCHGEPPFPVDQMTISTPQRQARKSPPSRSTGLGKQFLRRRGRGMHTPDARGIVLRRRDNVDPVWAEGSDGSQHMPPQRDRRMQGVQ